MSVYVYHYGGKSLPASSANSVDMYVGEFSVETKHILPEVVCCVFMIEEFQFVGHTKVSAIQETTAKVALAIVIDGLETSSMEYLKKLKVLSESGK